jgi:hypothetical protein
MSWFKNFSKGIKKATTGLATLTMYVASSMISTLPAQAFVDGEFRMAVDKDRSFVIDIAGDSFPKNGGPMQIHKKTTDYQRRSSTFFATYDKNANSYEIHSREDQKYCLATAVGLDYNRMGEATPVVLSPNCPQSNNWIFRDGRISPSRKQDYCIDYAWGKIQNYSKLQLIKCQPGNPAQQFVIERNGAVQPAQPNPPVVIKPATPTPITTPTPTNNFNNTYEKTISVTTRPPNGTQVACGPCVFVAVVVVTVIVERIVVKVLDKRAVVKWRSLNSKGETWENAAKACDTEDYYDFRGKKDYELVWYRANQEVEAHKSCIIYEEFL